jgi:hypothetical protein
MGKFDPHKRLPKRPKRKVTRDLRRHYEQREEDRTLSQVLDKWGYDHLEHYIESNLISLNIRAQVRASLYYTRSNLLNKGRVHYMNSLYRKTLQETTDWNSLYIERVRQIFPGVLEDWAKLSRRLMYRTSCRTLGRFNRRIYGHGIIDSWDLENITHQYRKEKARVDDEQREYQRCGRFWEDAVAERAATRHYLLGDGQ